MEKRFKVGEGFAVRYLLFMQTANGVYKKKGRGTHYCPEFVQAVKDLLDKKVSLTLICKDCKDTLEDTLFNEDSEYSYESESEILSNGITSLLETEFPGETFYECELTEI